MQVLCGTDIIEIDRIKSAIKNERYDFINRIYTKTEIEYCESKNENKYEHYAARFAGKEAVFKAVSQLLNNKYEINWKNIEILNTDISISHCREYAVAMVTVVI